MSVPGVSRNWEEEEWGRVKKEEKGRGQAFFFALTRSVIRFLRVRLEMNAWYAGSMGHFRISLNLFLKTSLGAHPFT